MSNEPTIQDALTQLDEFFGTLEGAIEKSERHVQEASEIQEKAETYRAESVETIRALAEERIEEANTVADAVVEGQQQRIEKIREEQWMLAKTPIVRPVSFVWNATKRVLGF